MEGDERRLGVHIPKEQKDSKTPALPLPLPTYCMLGCVTHVMTCSPGLVAKPCTVSPVGMRAGREYTLVVNNTLQHGRASTVTVTFRQELEPGMSWPAAVTDSTMDSETRTA